MSLYPLATPSWDIIEEEAIARVMASGHYSMGPEVAEFEKEFASKVGSNYAVMVNSGSSANLLMTAALFYRKEGLRLHSGDEVIVPAVSWPTTYYPLSQYGLKLVFVDIDRETLNYDISALSSAIGPATKAVMAVNLLGNPNDFTAISSLISGRDILLLEDNCESLGALFEGRSCGTFGIMGTFSTFFSHHLSTMEGGVVVTDDEELYHILLSLRAHGWTRNLPDTNKVSGVKNPDPFEESFAFFLPGYNVRPIEFEGAIGRAQLKKLDSFITFRRANAEHFCSRFSGDSRLIIQKEIGQSSWFGFSLVLRDGKVPSRRIVTDALAQAGIDCRPIVGGNFVKNPVVKHLDHRISGTLANANKIDHDGFFVGNHPYDIRDSIDYLVDTIDRLK